MARLIPTVLVVAASVLAGTSALAQLPSIFDTIFRGEPPRPPGSVPQPGNVPPPPDRLPPGPPPSPPGPRGGVQTQPLPPPPGASSAPLETRPQTTQPAAPAPGQPPGQRQTRATPTAPPPPDEVLVEPPVQKIVNPTAIFSGLDKITGRIITFEVAINETVRFGALEVTPRACYSRPPTETSNTDGFIEVDELTLQGELRRSFTGWMFAASPGLNAVEHPIYDIWLTDCKSPVVTAEHPAPPPPATTAAAPAPRTQQRPPQQLKRAPVQQQPQGYPPYR